MKNKKTVSISPEEAAIIAGAVDNAICFGTGILTACEEGIKDAGYIWCDWHAEYVFENYIDE